MNDLWRYTQGQAHILQFSTYIPAGHIVQHLSTEEGLEEAVALLRANGVGKVYLEVYRDGCWPAPDLLQRVRDHFRKSGFEAMGGITPTQSERFGAPSEGIERRGNWLCYTSRKTQDDIETAARLAAKLFEEVMIDDFYATSCRCAQCEAAKGDQSWPAYRRDLLSRVLDERVVQPAREENPKAKVILKYPQYYDRFHLYGYDVVREPRIADKIWVGTETRDPETALFGYTYPYEAYFIYRWVSRIGGERTGGAWFDSFDCDPTLYVEQAYQSVLAGAKEIVLFCYTPDLFGPENRFTSALREKMPLLYRLAESVQGLKPVGVHVYKPPHSDGGEELFLFDFLGMLGLPCIPSHEFPEDAEVLLLTHHAKDDPDISEKIVRFVSGGGTLIMTSGLLEALQADQTVMALAGYGRNAVRSTVVRSKTFCVEGETCTADTEVRLGADLNPTEASVIASARVGIQRMFEVPALTLNEVEGGGRVVVLNVRTCSDRDFSLEEPLNVPIPVSLIHLPQPCLDQLRTIALTPLGLKIESPAKVAVYLYDHTLLVMENFNDRRVEIKVCFDREMFGAVGENLHNEVDGGDIGADATGAFSVGINPRDLVILRLNFQHTSRDIL